MGQSSSFREQIRDADRLLSAVSCDRAEKPYREGGWLRKEVLGHLVDSALNNHQRFVRAALDGAYAGPGYDQDRWVDIHGYCEMAWDGLLQHWRLQNELLASVVERTSPASMEALCRVGDGEPVTLRFLIEDYLVHLQHHLRQIL